VLNSELQGNAVALLDPWGSHLAGRRAQGPSLAEVDIPDASGGTLAVLVVHGSFQSPGWPSVVNAVLALAVTPLIAWAATERLAAERDVALQSALAARLLALASSRAPASGRIGDLQEGAVPQGAPQGTPPEGADLEAGGDGTLARAAALRWPVGGPLTAYAIRPHDTDLDDLQMIGSVTAATVGPGPVLRREESWAGWSALPPDRLATRLAECLAALPVPCAAGVGAQVPDLGTMEESLLGAEAAAFVSPAGVVARSDRMGPAKLLAALPGGVLRAPAQMILEPLLGVDRDGTLLETLTAVLDEGGASRAAERLGVHRNTVTTRLERIRAAGFDVDDPGTRLALHLAAHVLRPRPVA
jgi:PucR C-terminal helix-turn-helix domain/GGDEF-like domain